MYEEMFREACWNLGLTVDLELFNRFLKSKEFEKLEMFLKATAYYEISNWLKMNDIE